MHDRGCALGSYLYIKHSAPRHQAKNDGQAKFDFRRGNFLQWTRNVREIVRVAQNPKRRCVPPHSKTFGIPLINRTREASRSAVGNRFSCADKNDTATFLTKGSKKKLKLTRKSRKINRFRHRNHLPINDLHSCCDLRFKFAITRTVRVTNPLPSCMMVP